MNKISLICFFLLILSSCATEQEFYRPDNDSKFTSAVFNKDQYECNKESIAVSSGYGLFLQCMSAKGYFLRNRKNP